MGKKCPYSELLWSAFSRIQTEYGEIRSISPYSVRMREIGDPNNSEYRHFSRSGCVHESDDYSSDKEDNFLADINAELASTFSEDYFC